MRNLQKFLWKRQNEWESVLAKFDSTCYNVFQSDLSSRDSLAVVLSGNRKEVGMNILEVLTLLLVVFAALTYIDNKCNRK